MILKFIRPLKKFGIDPDITLINRIVLENNRKLGKVFLRIMSVGMKTDTKPH